jgi:hypothetical protein
VVSPRLLSVLAARDPLQQALRAAYCVKKSTAIKTLVEKVRQQRYVLGLSQQLLAGGPCGTWPGTRMPTPPFMGQRAERHLHSDLGHDYEWPQQDEAGPGGHLGGTGKVVAGSGGSSAGGPGGGRFTWGKTWARGIFEIQGSLMPDSILLYRYLDAEAALKSIETRSFKVGRLKDFNDPFEWRPGITGIIPEGEMVGYGSGPAHAGPGR